MGHYVVLSCCTVRIKGFMLTLETCLICLSPDGLMVDSDIDDEDDMVFLVTNREGDLHDSSSDESKSESGSPDEKKPEEVSIVSLVQISDSSEQREMSNQGKTTHRSTDKAVDINRNSTDPVFKSKVKVDQQQIPASQVSDFNRAHIDSDTPRSSNRPLCTKRTMKPKKLIVRKRQTPSAKDLCSSWDVGILFLLVCFVTFVSLCVDLNPSRFLPMIFSGYVIYTFAMALLSGENTTHAEVNRPPT